MGSTSHAEIERRMQGASALIGTVGGVVTELAVGGGLGALVGPTFGQIMSNVGSDVAARMLSASEERRISQVVVQATGSLAVKVHVDGEQIRTDGFFGEEASDGEQIIEGVLLAARDAYEERKLPHIADMLANIAVTPTIDRASASYLVEISKRLTWRELEVLAIFEDDERFPMPERPMKANAGSWAEWVIRRTVGDLLGDGRNLLHHVGTKTTPRGIRLPATELSTVKLTNGGNLVAGTMELSRIPRAELSGIYETLIAAG